MVPWRVLFCNILNLNIQVNSTNFPDNLKTKEIPKHLNSSKVGKNSHINIKIPPHEISELNWLGKIRRHINFTPSFLACAFNSFFSLPVLIKSQTPEKKKPNDNLLCFIRFSLSFKKHLSNKEWIKEKVIDWRFLYCDFQLFFCSFFIRELEPSLHNVSSEKRNDGEG